MARYAVILAGGSGTRLWPVSRRHLPKQLIPFVDGKSLLELAYDRLDSLIDPPFRYICAGDIHEKAVSERLPGFTSECFIGEPVGRDTLNAIGLSAAVLASKDADAVMAVFTSDHIIKPVEKFREITAKGMKTVAEKPNLLLTFGITPDGPATGYGYLELGEEITSGALTVRRFKEKPDEATAKKYHRAGPRSYLWNSGMFVWKSSFFLECIRKYEPDVYSGLMRIAENWESPRKSEVIASIYPNLKKISVDFAVMEKATSDPSVAVGVIPMPLSWKDIGSWTAFGDTLEPDRNGNSGNLPALHADGNGNLVYSTVPGHLVATVGCNGMIIIHTPDATLVCPRDRAEEIKDLHGVIRDLYGEKYL